MVRRLAGPLDAVSNPSLSLHGKDSFMDASAKPTRARSAPSGLLIFPAELASTLPHLPDNPSVSVIGVRSLPNSSPAHALAPTMLLVRKAESSRTSLLVSADVWSVVSRSLTVSSWKGDRVSGSNTLQSAG